MENGLVKKYGYLEAGPPSCENGNGKGIGKSTMPDRLNQLLRLKLLWHHDIWRPRICLNILEKICKGSPPSPQARLLGLSQGRVDRAVRFVQISWSQVRVFLQRMGHLPLWL